ncbi:hypothetical protein KIN20_034655 [Parelaphostrongylus tenuis]|uniref:Uncharacterized protein n=1 Tax=Parelaphostrongylus tenuis TaxID=148309 RepID=A0AAD5WJ52_PARTN|nr:hypothetical protein KIN20_034655 [Parelaphostrongylus tenuis]
MDSCPSKAKLANNRSRNRLYYETNKRLVDFADTDCVSFALIGIRTLTVYESDVVTVAKMTTSREFPCAFMTQVNGQQADWTTIAYAVKDSLFEQQHGLTRFPFNENLAF